VQCRGTRATGPDQHLAPDPALSPLAREKSVARRGGRNARFRCELESSLWRNNVPFSGPFDRPRTLTIQFELVSELSALASRACVWLPPDATLEQAPKHARVKHPKHIELHVKADIEKLEA
jgi:hypothetical protein